ncbi:MAG: aldehyde dehydrogenase family protein [Actinobacteria bacterium]|nr:aldehyde dehydrogenase family protein [Actinomycetota bacterium]
MGATVFELPLEPAGVPRGRAMIERAEWAARAFATYDAATVARIADAAAQAAAQHAREFAEAAVSETGFGVVEHKVLKNIACSTGIIETYRGHDYVSPRIDEVAKIVEIPRPAGVVLALTPSTNPVATVLFNIVLALITRNAIVVCPHPYAKRVCAEAARVMAEAAVAAGAPDGCIQVVDEPNIALVDALMTDERTDVILATGGTAMVRAAYSSGNPAIGVGPGNVPVLVDRTADLVRTAERIIESKSFDHSILCTNESVLIVEDVIADRLLAEMRKAGGHVLDDSERDRVRTLLFPNGHLDTRWIGKSAVEIAAASEVTVPARTRVLLAPFELAVPEEMLAHEKLCPVLGVVRVPTAARGIEVAKAVLRISGAGHSAAIHSTDSATVMDFAAAVRVLRVAVNVGNSLGSSGIQTNLAPAMTIGTGFFGRSSVGENLEPRHLVNFTRIAYNADDRERMGDFSGLSPWQAPQGPVPAYPYASNERAASVTHLATVRPEAVGGSTDELREEIRRLIIDELTNLMKG